MTLKGVTYVLLLLSVTPFSRGNDCPAEGNYLANN